MFHVYVIISEIHPDRYYIGFSSRPSDRLTEHNAGKNPSTADFRP
jgi:predicted GIY-YIG superfamily endonuclease